MHDKDEDSLVVCPWSMSHPIDNNEGMKWRWGKSEKNIKRKKTLRQNTLRSENNPNVSITVFDRDGLQPRECVKGG